MSQQPTIDLEALVEDMRIPPVPEILTDLNRVLQKDEPDLLEIAALVEKDAGLAGLVLKAVNSPLFGLRNTVSSILQAVNLLGIGYTINIVMGVALRQTFESQGESLPSYWELPANVALVAAALTGRLTSCSRDEGYLLGLFHNAGHAMIHQRFPEYQEFYLANLEDPDFCITHFENEQYQFDHAVMGFYLARSWQVPAHLCSVIRHHHESDELLAEGHLQNDPDCSKGLLAILKIAEHVEAVFRGIDQDHEWARSKSVVLEYMGLSEDDYEEIRADMLEKLHTEAN